VIGCLRTTFRLVVIAVVALVLVAGWHWRREFRAMWRFWRGGAPETAAATGLVTPRALVAARDKVDSLNGWRADSVVLGPAEFAALFADGLPGVFRDHVDSLGATLGDGRVRLTGRLATTVIPRAALGPFASLLHDSERLGLEGRVEMLGARRGVWRVDGLALRGVTLPAGMVRRLTATSLGGTAEGAIDFAVPAGVRDLRVRPDGVTLYGGAR
jgi:hypothetical protein